jgi:N-acetylglutamate synthase-like GNAT family acetyltransferase
LYVREAAWLPIRWLQSSLEHAVPFAIRRATEQDVGPILECLRAAFEPYRLSYTADAFQDTVPTPEALRDRLATMVVLVALEPNAAIVGTVAGRRLETSEGHLRGMAVAPTWQGSGVADDLLEAIEGELRTLGCTRITVDTTGPLHKAIQFYQKHGYEPSGRVTDFFGMPLYEYVRSFTATRP